MLKQVQHDSIKKQMQMIREELIEEGIVIKSENGIAEVELKENESCDECSAKLFCKPGEDKVKTIKAFDPYNSRKGDTVKISVAGSVILKATLILYGIPLILLIVCIWIGLIILSASEFRELFSFLGALLVLGFYYVSIYFYTSKHKGKLNIARIISLHRNTN